MGVIYVVSVEEAAGKTAICAGLAKNIAGSGRKVGYLKPSAAEGGDNGDIAFMKQVLGFTGDAGTSNGHDTILAEGRLGPDAVDALSQKLYGAAREMKAKVIAVEAYTGDTVRYIDVYRGFGDSLLGVIVNKVPASQAARVEAEASARCKEAGITLFGILPESRALLAISVGELAGAVQGTILNNADKDAELVENYMLGAMVVDSGLDYFGRRKNKAAIIRQDRPDMQLAALETSTACLVLSGSSEPPLYNVQQKAESRGIPIIATETPVGDIVGHIEAALDAARMKQEKKLATLADITKQNLDLAAVA